MPVTLQDIRGAVEQAASWLRHGQTCIHALFPEGLASHEYASLLESNVFFADLNRMACRLKETEGMLDTVFSADFITAAEEELQELESVE